MQKILIANRSEIALRIMKTANKMGIQTVAIYSDADRESPHTIYADEAIHIGAAPSAESYLAMDKIIKAAIGSNADAIHPGYGFLSENSEFASRVQKAGLVFIGPPPKAIQLMGDKLAAKETAKKSGIPLVPGTADAVANFTEANQWAEKIGYPILIKASAGGGGKGMRKVSRAEDLEEQLKRAMSEAKAAFGDGSVFIEKYITRPKHIEIQILADQHGNVIHLFERDCSIQRRHQKIIEEAPSSILKPAVRDMMGQAAIEVARSCSYVGAGTVEFLFDQRSEDFYFLEMNTRLQVEHPVTECITNLDLVEEQINIARGKPLRIRQEDIKMNGHAIELRLYAEDPLDNFSPSIGKLTTYVFPSHPNLRIDNGYREGMDVPIYYDPMLAKIIVHGSNRIHAIQEMLRFIDLCQIKGPETTLSFGAFALNHPSFRNGQFDTDFVANYWSPEKMEKDLHDLEKLVAKLGLRIFMDRKKGLRPPITKKSSWFDNRVTR